MRKAERLACVDSRDRSAIDPLHIDAKLSAGAIFLVQLCAMILFGREQKAVGARKIGIDALVPADRLHTIHCGNWLS